jgi:hypothetical protein
MAAMYSRPYQVAVTSTADAALPWFSSCETLAVGWREGSAVNCKTYDVEGRFKEKYEVVAPPQRPRSLCPSIGFVFEPLQSCIQELLDEFVARSH